MNRLVPVALLALGWWLPACVFLIPGGKHSLVQQKVEVEEKLIVEKPPAPLPEGQQVTVINSVQKLPPGLFYHSGRDKKKLYALPDYPSTEAPHVVIGALAWKGGRYGTVPEAIKTRAAAWGGETLFCPPNSGFCYVVRVSPRPPEVGYPGFEELLAQEAGNHGKYKPDSRPVRVDLRSAKPIPFETTPSYCYVLLFAMDSTANLVAARTGLYGEAKSNDSLMSNRSLAAVEEVTSPEGIKMKAPFNGPYAHFRSFSQSLGCAAGDSKATIQFQAAGRSTDLGTGTAFVQILARRISKKELKRKSEEHRKALEEAKRAAEEQRRIEEKRRQEEEARRQRERQEADRRKANQRKSASNNSATSNYSLSLKNNCPNTVRLFIGKKPKYGSGKYTTVSSNSISSYSGFAPQGSGSWTNRTTASVPTRPPGAVTMYRSRVAAADSLRDSGLRRDHEDTLYLAPCILDAGLCHHGKTDSRSCTGREHYRHREG